MLAASSAITPAVTLDSTASMKARRVSSWVLAERSAPVCSSSRPVIRLNAVGQRLDLVLGLGDRHAGREIALLDPPRGGDQLADRAHQPVGEPQRGEDRQARR